MRRNDFGIPDQLAEVKYLHLPGSVAYSIIIRGDQTPINVHSKNPSISSLPKLPWPRIVAIRKPPAYPPHFLNSREKSFSHRIRTLPQTKTYIVLRSKPTPTPTTTIYSLPSFGRYQLKPCLKANSKPKATNSVVRPDQQLS